MNFPVRYFRLFARWERTGQCTETFHNIPKPVFFVTIQSTLAANDRAFFNNCCFLFSSQHFCARDQTNVWTLQVFAIFWPVGWPPIFDFSLFVISSVWSNSLYIEPAKKCKDVTPLRPFRSKVIRLKLSQFTDQASVGNTNVTNELSSQSSWLDSEV